DKRRLRMVQDPFLRLNAESHEPVAAVGPGRQHDKNQESPRMIDDDALPGGLRRARRGAFSLRLQNLSNLKRKATTHFPSGWLGNALIQEIDWKRTVLCFRQAQQGGMILQRQELRQPACLLAFNKVKGSPYVLDVQGDALLQGVAAARRHRPAPSCGARDKVIGLQFSQDLTQKWTPCRRTCTQVLGRCGFRE